MIQFPLMISIGKYLLCPYHAQGVVLHLATKINKTLFLTQRKSQPKGERKLGLPFFLTFSFISFFIMGAP